MSQPMFIVKLIKKWFNQVYVMASITKKPVVGGVVNRALFEGDDMIYLPRDKVLHLNRPLEDPESVVLPSQVVDHFIEKANYLWIMNDCICRDATHCKEYPINVGCLFLGEAAMGINPKLGRPATKEEARQHQRRAVEMGLIQLVGRIKLDKLWLNVRPGSKLLSICNCCPCCCLWGKISLIAPRIGDHITKMPGVTVTVSDQCDGCGTCAEDVCFMKAISVTDGRAVISEECRGCGRCVSTCPSEAIEFRIEDTGFVQKAIERLSPLVDVT